MTEPVAIDVSKGINNRLRDKRFPPGFVDDAVNVDYDDAGMAQTRMGTELLTVVDTGRQMWSDGNVIYYVADTGLYTYDPFNNESTLLRDGIGPSRVQFVSTARGVYFSNETENGRVLDGTLYPFSVPTPNAPELSLSGGRLFEGAYLVKVSFVGEDGEEGAPSESAWLDVSSEGGIVVNIQESDYVARVYCSPANDRDIYWQFDVPKGKTQAVITSVRASVPCETDRAEGFQPTPVFERFGGRLACAYGRTLRLSFPHRLGLTDVYPSFRLGSDITLVAGTTDGIYASTENNGTWFIDFVTDPAHPMPRQVLGHGAIKGSLAHISDRHNVVAWISQIGGVVIAGAGGEVTEKTRDYFTPQIPFGSVESLYREIDGIRQLVFSCRG